MTARRLTGIALVAVGMIMLIVAGAIAAARAAG